MANALIINDLLNKLNIKPGTFYAKIGERGETVKKAVQRKSDITTIIVNAIRDKFPLVCECWLYTGKGKMFLQIQKRTLNFNSPLVVKPSIRKEKKKESYSGVNNDAENELDLEDQIKEGDNMNMLSALIQSNKDQAQAVKDMAKAHLILSELLQSRYGEGEVKKEKRA